MEINNAIQMFEDLRDAAVRDAQQQVVEARTQASKIETEIAERRRQADDASATVTSLRKQIEGKRSELEALQRDVAELHERAPARKAVSATHARSSPRS